MRAYKTEIKLNNEQELVVNKTIGTCRFIYNFFIAYNKEIYEKDKKFISANDFSKYLNNDFLQNNEEYSWIKEVSTKSVKQSIINAEKAFKNFFKKKSKFPKFKKKKDNNVKMYFVRSSKNQLIQCERHKIKIPTLKFVTIKEKNYLPLTKNSTIISGTISKEADRYYVSVITNEESKKYNLLKNNEEAVGLDLGINKFIVTSNNEIYNNINKSKRIKKLEKALRRQQKKLSRKYEVKNKKIERKIVETTKNKQQ